MGLMGLLWPASRAEARLIDLTGEATLEYRLIEVSTTGGTDSQYNDLRELVTVGSNGAIFREALGFYQLNFTFSNDDRYGDLESNTQVYNYFGSLTFFPRVMPLALSAQRTTQEMESNTLSAPVPSGKVTVSIYNLVWDLPRVWKLPQLHLNVYYSTVETNSCTPLSPPSCDNTSRTFGGSLTATDQYPYRYIIKNTVLTWNLSMSGVQQFNNSGTDMSVGGRMTADSQWTPEISSNVRASYTTGLSSQTPVVPGIVANVSTAGFTVFYRPSLKLNSNFTYDFTRDTNDRHIGGFDVFYRPTPQFDITVSGRGSYLDLDYSQVASGYGSVLVLYRPTLNLNAAFSDTAGLTTTTTDATTSGPHTKSTSLYHNFASSVTYFQLYELVRINVSGGVAMNNTIASGSNQSNVNTFWMMQATNTKTQYITVTGTYSGYYNDQLSGDGTTEFTNMIRTDATSSYFRELLLRGDTLTVHAGAGDTAISGGVDNIQTIDVGADLLYGWRGWGVGGGLSSHITTAQGDDYNSFFTSVNWTVPPMLPDLQITVDGRYEDRLMTDPGRPDMTIATANVNGTYQIGLVMFNLQYEFNYFNELSSTVSHNLYFRLTRQFSL